MRMQPHGEDDQMPREKLGRNRKFTDTRPIKAPNVSLASLDTRE